MGPGIAASPGWPLPSGNLIVGMAMLIGMGFLCDFELIILLLTQFKRKSGLYYWSLVVAVVGSTLFNIGSILYYFAFGYDVGWLTVGMFAIGYMLYIPSEYAVLYSRLNLLSASRRVLRFVMILTIAEAILVALPNVILGAGFGAGRLSWEKPYSIYQRVEVCVYATTETAISATYIYLVTKTWRNTLNPKAKKVLNHLIYTSIFIALLQFCSIIAQFAGNYQIQGAWVCFLYSFQLKLEFWILNKLTVISTSNLEQAQSLDPSTSDTFTTQGTLTSQSQPPPLKFSVTSQNSSRV